MISSPSVRIGLKDVEYTFTKTRLFLLSSLSQITSPLDN